MLKFDYNESDFWCFRIAGQIRINYYLKLLFTYLLICLGQAYSIINITLG